jgi:hypothetical protein
MQKGGCHQHDDNRLFNTSENRRRHISRFGLLHPNGGDVQVLDLGDGEAQALPDGGLAAVRDAAQALRPARPLRRRTPATRA